MPKRKDITGMRSGRLVAIKYLAAGIWECKCDCGNNYLTSSTNICRGYVKSCGCFKAEKWVYRHNESRTSLYRRWMLIRHRCYNPLHTSYKYAGAKGIKMCDEWLNSFEAFKKWSIENGYNEDLILRRIDFNGDFEPSNCKWVAIRKQLRGDLSCKRDC